MNITGSLSTALAVFIGLDGAVLALMLFPPGNSARTHVALMTVALLILLALGLLGNG